MNPLKKIRIHYGITQLDLADACSVERGTVIDAEQGMFRTVPPSMLRVLSKGVPEDAKALMLDYHTWVLEARRQNAVSFNLDYSDLETFEDFCIAVGGSVRGFCRALVIQRSIVTDYIRKGHRWQDIMMALSDVGLSESHISLLERLPRE
jgi:transcriptional regulator with XRE-family HTH domain